LSLAFLLDAGTAQDLAAPKAQQKSLHHKRDKKCENLRVRDKRIRGGNCWGIIIPHSGSARVGLYSVGSDYSGSTFGREGRLGREWKRSRYYMVGRESPGSLAFIRILVLVKSGQKSACSTMPSIFTPYWSLFTLYNNKTFAIHQQ